MKKRNLRILILFVVTAMLLTGCKRNNAKENPEENNIEASDVENTSPADDNDESVNDVSDASELKTEETEKLSKEAYERFLNNHEPIYFDECNLNGEWLYDEEDYGDRFNENTPYRFEEMIDSFVQYMDVSEAYNFRMGRVEYAYIDCDADNITELALRIADFRTSVGTFTEEYVIKLIDNKLQLCYSYEYGDQSDLSLYKDGYTLDKAEWNILIEAPPEPVVINNPGWEYYCDDSLTESSSHISLEKISQKANDIIDEDDWFYSLNIRMPDRSDQSYNDYYFHMYGDDELDYYHNMLEISDMDGEKIADLDFSEFYIPDNYYPSDYMFVAEAIYSPKIVDGILYISAYHRTYASSASHNGYIMAIDMNNDYKVLWKTEPLTCNASNFEIVGDTIICGYGFTNEDDFIYLLDRNTGKRVDTIKVKTGPEYFYVDEDDLYVRTYDTDYKFKIIYP